MAADKTIGEMTTITIKVVTEEVVDKQIILGVTKGEVVTVTKGNDMVAVATDTNRQTDSVLWITKVCCGVTEKAYWNLHHM